MKLFRRVLVIVGLLGLATYVATVSLAPAPSAPKAGVLRLEMAGAPKVVFDHAVDACEPWDIPDAPARAYRDDKGQVRLFQTHFRNRAMVGPRLDEVRRTCRVVFEGRESDNPADFDDRGWIAATYTNDGKHIFALVHNEFQGNRRKQLCPSQEYMKCWYNSITAARSNDSGDTFTPLAPRLVATLPLRADQTMGGHAGFFNPTNIVRWQGAYYVMANVVSRPPQKNGNCLLRTTNLDDASAWRLWRNGAFASVPANPYAGEAKVDEHLCDPVDSKALPNPVSGLILHAPSQTWIATMAWRDRAGRSGIFYSTSRDLLNWEGPHLLMETPFLGSESCMRDGAIAYPTLLDPDSLDRNFMTMGPTALLTYTRFAARSCVGGNERNLVTQKIRARLQ